MGKHKIAVYGSLRTGCYNRRGFNSMKTLDVVNIEGYKMHSLGSYPYIIEDKGYSVKVELCECNDIDYKYIRSMELGAGYTEKDIEVNGETYKLYVYNNHFESSPLVETGDWVEFNA